MKSQAVDHVLLETSPITTSLRSLVEGYILNCRCEGKSQATLANYLNRLRCFMWFCQEHSYPDEPHKITTEHIRQFLCYVASEPVRWNGSSTSARKATSQSTVNHYYRALNTFFAWLKREELIADNPVTHIKTPKIEQKVIQALNPQEVTKLLERFSGKSYLDVRNRAIVMMLLDTGMRVFELANLRLDDIDTSGGSILVKRGKGSKQRVVRIGNKAQKALWKYVTLYRRGASDRLFLNRSGEPLGVTGIKLMIRRLGKKVGVANVHVHRLRHTFAISFLRAGGDVFSLQYLLGHSTLAMTQRYLQSLNADDAVNAHRRCSPLDNMT
jgi:site-specific recombinase XerD